MNRFTAYITSLWKRSSLHYFLGFPPEEYWNLDTYAARWILPRLKALRENTSVHPRGLSMEQWQNTLDKMIFSFEYYSKGDYTNMQLPRKDERDVQRGLDLFAKWYSQLWY